MKKLKVNPYTDQYMICAHLNENPNQNCVRLLDKPVDIGDSGIYYLCEKCSKEPTRLPPDMFDYVTHQHIPDAEFVIEEVVINPKEHE
jgi:hypothetical protein